MGRFTKIPSDAFDKLQLDAGVLLKRFDPDNPQIVTSDIVCATTGGINPSCVAEYSDFAEDVDNAPNNLMEFKHLDGWTCTISTTGLGTSPELIKLALGAADINGETKIVPRRDLKMTDFTDLWWVGDKANGGFVAIRLMNALSTGGFSLQTGKNAKGQVSLEITGHVSAAAQDVVPMEFYSSDDTGEDSVTVEQILTNVTSDFEGVAAPIGEAFNATLTAVDGYVIENVILLVNGKDVTLDFYNLSTGVIDVPSENMTGNIIIIATANQA